ncbi:protein of unknown function [Limnospira indica PCC 8005]|uniref:Uncharacterized protein n=1 Tax=Limnospira indica PCC 8005 TaxID=376219 RepID=A0A9P1NZE2_9CYAN|nr:protein of unknown function [Limnospira indica PCC 8005]
MGESPEESFQAPKEDILFQAAKSGQDAKARRLQRLLVKSYYACETFRSEIGMQCPK